MTSVQDRLPIDLPMDEIVAFCQRWNITELALFGSVLRDDFGPESDVDVLVEFDPDARVGLITLAEIEEALSRHFLDRVSQHFRHPGIYEEYRPDGQLLIDD